jgi:Leucine-rich repeat (LRR) protein
MKQLLLMIAVVVLVGCGKKETLEEQAKPKAPSTSAPKVDAVAAWVSDPNDPNNVKIEAAIRYSADKLTGKLTKADLEKVKTLSFWMPNLDPMAKKEVVIPTLSTGRSSPFKYKKLTSVKGLEKLPQLTYLVLSNNQLTDVKGLEKLDQLKVLFLYDNKLTSVQGLENLTQLTRLELHDNQLTSVKGLEKLTQLEWLYLYDNKLTSVKELENLPQLRVLNLYNNQLTSVKGLEKLTQLTSLNLHNNQLTDVKGLERLTKLTYLSLSRNQLTSVKGLEKLPKLTYLDLRFNPDLTKAQINELQKALPNCKISSNPTK